MIQNMISSGGSGAPSATVQYYDFVAGSYGEYPEKAIINYGARNIYYPHYAIDQYDNYSFQKNLKKLDIKVNGNFSECNGAFPNVKALKLRVKNINSFYGLGQLAASVSIWISKEAESAVKAAFLASKNNTFIYFEDSAVPSGFVDGWNYKNGAYNTTFGFVTGVSESTFDNTVNW